MWPSAGESSSGSGDDSSGEASHPPDPTRHHSYSLSSPPPPPDDYNPPVGSLIDSPAGVVSPVSTSSHSSSFSLATMREGNASSSPDLERSASYSHTGRPELRAFQRASQSSLSYPSPSDSQGSVGTSGSDGGGHLVEARERLLHDGGSESGPSSRRVSETHLDSYSDLGDAFEFNLINPTPPLRPVDDLPPPLSQVDREEKERENSIHAWDSVWPAPGSAHRVLPSIPIPPEAGPSKFPSAPMSPFQTPSFSPIFGMPSVTSPVKIKSPSHRSPSPSSFRYPSRPEDSPANPHVDLHLPPLSARRRSVTAQDSPTPSQSHSAHHRSMSNSSTGSASRFSERYRNSPPQRPHSPTHHPHSAPQANPYSTPVPPPSSLSEGASVKRTRSKTGGKSSSAATGRRRGYSLSGSQSPVVGAAVGVAEMLDRRDSPRPPEDAPSTPRKQPLSPKKSPQPVSSERSPLFIDTGRGSPPSEHLLPSNSLPPISLPPAITPATTFASTPLTLPGDDGMVVGTFRGYCEDSHSSPPSSPVARPAGVRRTLSDNNTRSRPATMLRTMSMTSDVEKSPKRTPAMAELSSPSSPSPHNDADTSRAKKSPRKSPLSMPSVAPLSSIPPLAMDTGATATEGVPSPNPTAMNDVLRVNLPSKSTEGGMPASLLAEGGLVDEGDILPPTDGTGVQVDVTFDDEGLNTLERIFLLSKSEYPFHRAYVARVLGDLLNDVDPCESVEYVLPLLSGFSIDDDESVKEAFASEVHRVLWYFYSRCKLLSEDPLEIEEDEERDDPLPDQPAHTVTITSEGMDIVPRPSAAELAALPNVAGRRASVMSLGGGAPSSAGSTLTHVSSAFSAAVDDGKLVDTPGSTVSSSSSQDTAFSPGAFINPYTEEYGADSEKGWAKDAGPLVDQPSLSVSFFTPLLGSLLLSQNPNVSDPVRNGVVSIIGRLKNKGPFSNEIWGPHVNEPEVDERRTFASQNGPHSHDLRPFTTSAKAMIERELLNGIVIGMGRLSTEMPDMLFGDGEEDGVRAMESYADELPYEGADEKADLRREAEAFQAQLVQEATIGQATSVNLIGAISEFYSAEEVVDKGFIDELLRAKEGDVAVRAEAAVALSFVAKVAPLEKIYEVIPLAEQFITDEVDHVRQSACLSLPALCRRIDSSDNRREFAVNAVSILVNGSEDVRCAALEMLGEVIYIFHDDPMGPPQELLDMYMDDSDEREVEGPDSDWDLVASFNFPGVCLTLGPDRWPDLRGLYQRLQQRAGERVLRTTASSLHELAKILRPDQVAQDIMPVCQRCLGCDEEIRERIFEHLNILIDRLPIDVAWDLVHSLDVAWKTNTLGGWRARERLAIHIPSFMEIFHKVQRLEEVLEMFKSALLDPFAAVREAATLGVPRVFEVLRNEPGPSEKFREILLDLGNSSSFKQRVTFVRCLRSFIKPPPNKEAFEDFFLHALPRLANDIVDVRIGLAQTIADLFRKDAFYHEGFTHVPESVVHLVLALAEDDSADIRQIVSHVDLQRFDKGKQPEPQSRHPLRQSSLPLPHTTKHHSTDTVHASSPHYTQDVASRLSSIQLSSGDVSSATPKMGDAGPSSSLTDNDPFENQFALGSPSTS
ncbi:serine/threonine-protein phosphatase 4 regulatory subunit 1, partial [Tremellales sp. Uapishka_1]